MSKSINIIGAGFSGLSAAATLAKKGYKVTVLEKNATVGGRARLLKADGFRFDMGPTWYWMPDVFERFFHSFGKKTEDYYQLKRVDPGYRMYFGEDDFIDVPANLDQLYDLFEQIEKGSAGKLKRFLKKAEYKYHVGINELVYLPGDSFLELIRPDLLAGMLKLDFFKSVSSYVRTEFKSEKLRQILEFPVIFLGATPQKTPALYTLMNYADLTLGTWYPLGGMYSVVEAMKSVAEEFGAEFLTNHEVSKIIISEKKQCSLISNGKEFTSDGVIAAADYHHVEQKLLPGKYRLYSEGYWNKRTLAPSSLLFYLGINKKLKVFQHHNLFFDKDFKKHAEEIYDTPKWPGDPAIYVSNNTVSDPGVAPEGMDNLIILIPVAPDLEDNEQIRDQYFNLVMGRLEKITGQNIKENIIFRKSYAHKDFIRDYNSYKGNAYGLANTLFQTANLKPAMRNKKLQNFFYTGQLTVPGPGVPPAIISGQVVSGQIEKYLK